MTTQNKNSKKQTRFEKEAKALQKNLAKRKKQVQARKLLKELKNG